jgi:hypothetical protein
MVRFRDDNHPEGREFEHIELLDNGWLKAHYTGEDRPADTEMFSPYEVKSFYIR